jgi:DNA-directed RNA polymerase subunit RPC12/RpoP
MAMAAMKPVLETDVWGEDADGNRGEKYSYFVCPKCKTPLLDDYVCLACGQEIEYDDDL